MLERVKARMAVGEPVRLVSFGDSISEVGRSATYCGGATCPEHNWAFRVRAGLAAAFPAATFTLTPAGIGGQNTYEGLGRFDWLPDADLVLVAFGANDCGWHEIPPESTAVALARILDMCRDALHVDTLVMSLGGENPLDYGMVHMEETRQAQRRVATEQGVPFVDIRGAVLRATNGGACWSDFHNGPRDCHPNDRGHAAWAEAVLAVLTEGVRV
jgi:lysophospholipase L1-like esterase